MATKGKNKYIEAVGRRKNAVARVRIVESTKEGIEVNNRAVEDYFATETLRKIARQALEVSRLASKYKITAKISGGGVNSQAEALRHGISRALLDKEEAKPLLKKAGFLKRDPRKKERKKFGLKKARKRAQWSKR